MILYLDSSAIVKLIQSESESSALRRYLRRHREDRRLTSTLARVEVLRAVASGGAEALALARRQLGRIDQLVMDPDLLDAAGMLRAPVRLRSLDAIHLASALEMSIDLRAVVTYDQRLGEAATALNLPVVSPA